MKIARSLFTAALLAGSSSAAEAQLTHLNGVNACFLTASGTSVAHYQSNGNSAASCADNSASTRWTMPGSLSSDDDRFQFDRATPDAPGGSTLALTFGANNKSNVFNLGFFQFDNRDNSSANASSVLRFQLFLNNVSGSSGLTYDGLTVNYFDQGNSAETYSFSGGLWSSWFAVGTQQYRFAVVGYDTPHPGNAANYCQDYASIPTAQYGEASNGKLCGQFERMPVTTAPEPSTYVLMAAGLMGVGIVSRRRRAA